VYSPWSGTSDDYYALYNSLTGKFVRYFEINDIPSWYDSKRERKWPDNSAVTWSAIPGYKASCYKLWFNYKSDYEIEVTSQCWRKLTFVDTPPNGNMVFLSEDYDEEGKGIYAFESELPNRKKMMYSFENNYFGDQYYSDTYLRISNNGEKIAIANSDGVREGAANWDIIVLDILKKD
jgi:hypothetical protein